MKVVEKSLTEKLMIKTLTRIVFQGLKNILLNNLSKLISYLLELPALEFFFCSLSRGVCLYLHT